MRTKEDVAQFCLGFAGAYRDLPFDDNFIAMRHAGNKRIFALIYDHEGQVRVNVKADPERIYDYREAFSAVTPGYHMNKNHWNTITLDGSMTDEEIAVLLAESFDLTKPKIPRHGAKNNKKGLA